MRCQRQGPPPSPTSPPNCSRFQPLPTPPLSLSWSPLSCLSFLLCAGAHGFEDVPGNRSSDLTRLLQLMWGGLASWQDFAVRSEKDIVYRCFCARWRGWGVVLVECIFRDGICPIYFFYAFVINFHFLGIMIRDTFLYLHIFINPPIYWVVEFQAKFSFFITRLPVFIFNARKFHRYK